MLASPVKENMPFNDKDWVFEIKWDGYRAIADLREGLKFYSRNGLNFEKKFAPIARELSRQTHSMILDGEVVAYNENGMPDFQTLQHYQENSATALIYQVFDLLFLNGHSTEELTLLERKELLKEALDETDSIKYCDHVVEKGIAFFKEAVKANLEGIIAKKAGSGYTEGVRSRQWLKIKHHNTEEVVIAGFTAPRGSRKKFGALILGRYKGGSLIYAGHTGTGFDDRLLEQLYADMTPLIIKESPFKVTPKTNSPATWLQPKLVGNIKYSEITRDGIFRHPVFIAMREDKEAKEVTVSSNSFDMSKIKAPSKKTTTVKKQRDSKPIERSLTINGHRLTLTNQQKIYWPEEGYTKGDLIDYYESMANYILPYLKNRPESLNRFPNGIEGDSFYHKDAGDTAPDWVKTIPLFSESTQKEIDYIICNDKATLLYLANLGCIEMNPWNSVIKKIDNPDYLIIDVDPSEKNNFDQVIETTLATKSVLDDCGAPSYCKTSGASGMHIFVPLGGKYSYDQAKDFAHLIAIKVTGLLPDLTTLERSLKKRDKKKIYIDYLQNRKGQTIASAYSIRPKKGATASTPLDWKEVKKGLHPSQFDIKTLPARVKNKGDLFKPVLGKGIDVLKCLKKLQDMD